MSFILEDAFEETKSQYQLKIVAGKKGLSKSVSWVYQLEETSIISHFWGEEMAVTLGLGFQTSKELIHLIEVLIEHDASGLFVNIGPYISKIDEDVIVYCNEHDFPLITVPWEIIIADLIKDYCTRVFRDENEERELSKAFIMAIETPGMQDIYQQTLNRKFDMQGNYQVALLVPEKSDTMVAMQKRRLLFQLKKAFDAQTNQYIAFWYQDSFALIVNNMPESTFSNLLNDVKVFASSSNAESTIHIGCGSSVDTIVNLHHGYKRAKAALRMAILKNDILCYFKDMGVYQILFSVEDTQLLKNLYEDTLAPLREFDELHNTSYEETLYYFLKYNGSIQTIAETTYTHRNTVLYRIKKMKELLGKELDTTDERFPYQVAFYVKDILRYLLF